MKVAIVFQLGISARACLTLQRTAQSVIAFLFEYRDPLPLRLEQGCLVLVPARRAL